MLRVGFLSHVPLHRIALFVACLMLWLLMALVALGDSRTMNRRINRLEDALREPVAAAPAAAAAVDPLRVKSFAELPIGRLCTVDKDGTVRLNS